MEITIQEIDEAINYLRTRAVIQAQQLVELASDPVIEVLKPAHAALVQRIYRMTLIRDGLVVDEPQGDLLH